LEKWGEFMAIHDGHRQRLRERFLKEGLDHFDDLYVLEILLFYCCPRKDTNETAHNLLNRFGSLANVLEAGYEDLQKVPGIGEHAACFLNLVYQVFRRYQIGKAGTVTILRDVAECGEFLVPYFYGRKNEVVYILCLDAKRKLLSCKEMGEGSINSAGVPIRRIVEYALGSNATSVVLAHNHPSGLAIPSQEDVYATRRLAVALDAVDVILADHLVISDGDFVSMVQSGYYKPGEALCFV
jgi:DNA repair protein RadC